MLYIKVYPLVFKHKWKVIFAKSGKGGYLSYHYPLKKKGGITDLIYSGVKQLVFNSPVGVTINKEFNS